MGARPQVFVVYTGSVESNISRCVVLTRLSPFLAGQKSGVSTDRPLICNMSVAYSWQGRVAGSLGLISLQGTSRSILFPCATNFP